VQFSPILNHEMNKKVLLIGGALFGVLLIAGGGFFFWRQRKAEELIGLPDIPEDQQRGPLVTPPSAEEMPYETFQTEDGQFSFDYPATWISTDIGAQLETLLPKEFIDKYKLSMPLLLSDLRGTQLGLSTYHFEKGLGLGAIMDTLKEELVAMGQPYNEVGREMVGESLVVDSTVDAGQGVTMRIRDVLFLAPNDPKNIVYNLSFSARQSNWGDYETIFDHLQNSAQLSL